jgi:GTP-binding protein Era
MTKFGYVAIVGRPNVGKSTLLNCLLDKKLSITSPKPQTTRGQILGIKTKEDIQAVYLDTPGLHSTEKSVINRYMNRVASTVILDADIIVFIVDATKWVKEDELVLKKLKQVTVPIIVAINKIDKLTDKTTLLPLITQLNDQYRFAYIVPISALNADNVHTLEKQINMLLPTGLHGFSSDQVTDKSVYFQVAEIIREKLIRETEEEVPYMTAVEVEEWQPAETITAISVIIWVEREGQKVIVLGKKGARLKKIGIQARREIEALLDSKIFLRLWIKVKKNWTNSHKALRSLGYE